MNRILEFTPSQEEAVVSRILVLVHQAIDDAFPQAENANRKFTKTVFSEEGGEKTAAHRPGEFAQVEDTSPDGRSSDPALPPPPPQKVPPPPPPRAKTPQAPAQAAEKAPLVTSPQAATKGASRTTRLDTHMEKMGVGEGPDWVTRITLALLIAGLLLLAYVMFA